VRPSETITRFGSSIVINSGFHNAGTTQAQPGDNHECLLEVNLADIDRHRITTFGGWALILSCYPEWIWDSAIDNYLMTAVPLVARISIGSGGGSHVLYANAYPGIAMNVPAMTVRVDVYWDPLPAYYGLGAGDPDNWKIPNWVRVVGTIMRATVVPRIRRYFHGTRYNAQFPGIPVNIEDQNSIPPLAKTVLAYGDRGTNGIYQVGSYLELGAGNLLLGDAGVCQFSGPTLEDMKDQGERGWIPGNCDTWLCVRPSATRPGSLVTIDFEITT
jgi:hypothetical protein